MQVTAIFTAEMTWGICLETTGVWKWVDQKLGSKIKIYLRITFRAYERTDKRSESILWDPRICLATSPQVMLLLLVQGY